MRKKVLFVATADYHIKAFHLPYLKMFKDNGYEVHVATGSDGEIEYCDKKIKIPIARSPFKVSNLQAIRELREIIRKEKYDIIHCHTPMGGVVARMASVAARKRGTRVIYTAHGFHFYSGAPFYYWVMFYPVEKYLAKYTDTLITINDEDYKLAERKFRKRCRDIVYVPGVGVDSERFRKKMTENERLKLMKSLGINDGDIVMICVGRLDKNKNQGFLIDVLRELLKTDKRYKLLLVGLDELGGEYQQKAHDVMDRVIFAGFRKDVPKLFQIADVAVSASKREGLPVNIVEAAMSGLPIVMLKCRGCEDIEKNYNNIHVVSDNFVRDFAMAVKKAKRKAKDERINVFASNGVYEKMWSIYEK